MTDAKKIQLAADLIHDELHHRGTHVPPDVCLALARRLHDIWRERHDIRNLAPEEVARRFRERYTDGNPPEEL